MPSIETLVDPEDATRLGSFIALYMSNTGQRIQVIWGEEGIMNDFDLTLKVMRR